MSGGARPSKRRVGVLAYGLDRPLTGVSRVAVELGRALSASPEWEPVFLTPHRRGHFRAPPFASVPLPGCRLLPGLMLLGGPLLSVLSRRHKLDVLFDPVGVAPFPWPRKPGEPPRVVTLHDAIALRCPKTYPWLNNLLHRRYIPHTLKNVDVVVTVSQHAKREIEHLIPSAGNVHVIPNGVSPRFRPRSEDEVWAVLRKYGLRQPFVLSVAAQQPRKNLHRLVQAYDRIRASHPTLALVVAGPTPWRTRHECTAARDAESEGVRWVGYVHDDDLPSLYSAATVLAFPSLHEGFGLPVLEAMACGTPVVCSSHGALAELASGAAELCDAEDVDSIAAALHRVLGDSDLRLTLRQRGLERAGHYTWHRAATAYAEHFAALASRTPA